VPDELTFAAGSTRRMPDWNVACWPWVAIRSPSLAHFRTPEGRSAPTIIVILGSAYYFDVRHVVAPSRLLEIESWLERHQPADPAVPAAARDAGSRWRVTIDAIDQRSPRSATTAAVRSIPAETTDVTAALVNQIAVQVAGQGSTAPSPARSDNPVRRRVGRNVEVIAPCAANSTPSCRTTSSVSMAIRLLAHASAAALGQPGNGRDAVLSLRWNGRQSAPAPSFGENA